LEGRDKEKTDIIRPLGGKGKISPQRALRTLRFLEGRDKEKTDIIRPLGGKGKISPQRALTLIERRTLRVLRFKANEEGRYDEFMMASQRFERWEF
jgi:ribosomal protein S27E